MNNGRWELVQTLFYEAVRLPPSERAAFLETACAHNRELIDEILSLLKADSNRGSLLDRDLSEVAYRIVSESIDSAASHEFGPYRLKKILGEGGMGVVWLAERKDAGNAVAIKFLPHAGLSPTRRERFTREIKTLAKLTHPFIARLYDAGTLGDGTPWFVMEYVEGLHITDYCEKNKIGVTERLQLFRLVCEAVQHIHGQEIIHRDLKPSNILVEENGTPRLLDFGIARHLQNRDDLTDQTQAGFRFMSPDYAPPEWILNGSVGFYTDVYSLGVVLYEMLCGRLPFKQIPTAEGVWGEVHQRCSIESNNPPKIPRDPSLSKGAWIDLNVLCLKAIHQDVQERYRSVEALIRDIDHYLKEEPLEARTNTVRYRLGKFVTRNKGLVLASSLALGLSLGLIVFFTWRLAEARDRANRQKAIATAMNRFLSEDILARSDPFRSGNAKESFVDVVDQASPQIDLQFRDEPAVAAQLHQTIARAFDSRSDYARARREFDRAADLFTKSEGYLSRDVILVHLLQADMEARSQEPGSLVRAKSMLNEAETAISRMSPPLGDLKVHDLSTRAAIAIVQNDPHNANQNLSDALRQAQDIPSFDESARLQLKQRLAFSYIRMGDGAKAEALFRELIDTYSGRSGPESPNVLQARVSLAQALLIQRKYSEVIQEANLIYPSLVARLGEDHAVTMKLLSARAASEGYVEMWDEAIADDMKVYDLAVQKQGPGSYLALVTLSDAAQSQCFAGRYADGEVNARRALYESRQALGPRSGVTGGISYELAICLIARNKLDEASELLHNIDVKAVTQSIGDDTVGASISLAEAEIAARRGEYDSARHLVQTIGAVFDRPDADANSKKQLQRVRDEIHSHRLTSK